MKSVRDGGLISPPPTTKTQAPGTPTETMIATPTARMAPGTPTTDHDGKFSVECYFQELCLLRGSRIVKNGDKQMSLDLWYEIPAGERIDHPLTLTLED